VRKSIGVHAVINQIEIQDNLSNLHANDMNAFNNMVVQSRFAETLTLTLTPNPNFGESGFGESGRHRYGVITSL